MHKKNVIKLLDEVEEMVCQGNFNGAVLDAFLLEEAIVLFNEESKSQIIFSQDSNEIGLYISFFERIRRELE